MSHATQLALAVAIQASLAQWDRNASGYTPEHLAPGWVCGVNKDYSLADMGISGDRHTLTEDIVQPLRMARRALESTPEDKAATLRADLLDGRAGVGLWYDRGRLFIDVVRAYGDDMHAAIQAAKRNGEQAIFNTRYKVTYGIAERDLV